MTANKDPYGIELALAILARPACQEHNYDDQGRCVHCHHVPEDS